MKTIQKGRSYPVPNFPPPPPCSFTMSVSFYRMLRFDLFNYKSIFFPAVSYFPPLPWDHEASYILGLSSAIKCLLKNPLCKFFAPPFFPALLLFFFLSFSPPQKSYTVIRIFLPFLNFSCKTLGPSTNLSPPPKLSFLKCLSMSGPASNCVRKRMFMISPFLVGGDPGLSPPFWFFLLLSSLLARR